MTNINRRGFIRLLAASVAAASMPSYSIASSGRVEVVNQKLVLTKPLDLRGEKNFLIQNCEFYPSADFEGRALVMLEGGCGKVHDCGFSLHSQDGVLRVKYMMFTGEGLGSGKFESTGIRTLGTLDVEEWINL